MDICDLSAIALAGMLRDGELSAGEVLDAVLTRADHIAETVTPFTLPRSYSAGAKAVRCAECR